MTFLCPAENPGRQALRGPSSDWKGLQLTCHCFEPGTCTLAIVMVQDFPNPASLPGGSKTGPSSDSTTYYNLWKVAGNLIEQCVMRRGEMGWQSTGMAHEAYLSSPPTLLFLCAAVS